MADSELESSVLCGGGRTHNDLPVPIGFNPALDLGQFGVG